MTYPINDYIQDVTPALVIVPADLHDRIRAMLDVEIAKWPGSEKDRDILHSKITAFFHKYGYLPEFTLQPIEVTP